MRRYFLCFATIFKLVNIMISPLTHIKTRILSKIASLKSDCAKTSEDVFVLNDFRKTNNLPKNAFKVLYTSYNVRIFIV